MTTLESAVRLRSRGYKIPILGKQFETYRLEQIAIRQNEILIELDQLDKELFDLNKKANGAWHDK